MSNGIVLQIQADTICRRTCDFCSIRVEDPDARNMTFDEIALNLDYFDSRYGIRRLILASGMR